jgi:hypothetical protein
MKRFRSLYGAGPVNLVVILLSFAIAGAAVEGWFQRPRDVETVIEWFVAAILLHDLVAVPLYTLLDRIAFGWLRRRPGGGSGGGARRRTVLGAVNSTPYLRIPAILSGLLLIVFFPVVFGLGSQSELDASGIAESGYLARWLIASGVMFGLSGVVWGVAVGRTRGGGVAAGGAGGGAGSRASAAPAPAGDGAAPVSAHPAAPPGRASAPEPPPDEIAPDPPPDQAAGDDSAPPASDDTAPSDDSAVPPDSDQDEAGPGGA